MKRTVISLSLMVVLLAGIALLSGCGIIIQDSPAPGCVKYLGPMTMTGCFGKSIITDVQVEPELDCLEVGVNNCNGGMLWVRNTCGKPVALGGIDIPGSGEHVSLDVVVENGVRLLTLNDSNLSRYVPQEDEPLEFAGVTEGGTVRVSFTKTKKLCD